ncbi:MAG: hypothetical protein KDD82_11895 [Planctomycetes bacterium]|nr:hypothetical protein [Planctomycetota bacterium]
MHRRAPKFALLLCAASIAPAWAQGQAALSLESRVFDPKLAGATLRVTTRLPGSGSYGAQLTVRDAQGALVRRLAEGSRLRGRDYVDVWDGLDEAGRFVAPGDYPLRFSAGGAAREVTVHVVRLGVRAVAFSGAGRVPLTYHRAEAWAGSAFAVDNAGAAWTLPRSPLGVGCLDGPDGAPLELPAPWWEVDGPPRAANGSLLARGRSLPVAYQAGATPQVTATLGDAAGHGGRAVGVNFPAGRPLRLVVEGGQPASGMLGEVRPGDRVTLDLPALGPQLGKWLLRVRFAFAYREDDGSWRRVPGGQVSEHLLYTVLAAPSARDVPGGRPWVAALDLASRWLTGDVRTQASALERIVAGVNAGLGLRYEDTQGAPAYTDGLALESPELDLTAFLAGRANGRVVNCLDCASVVTQLGAQLGARGQVEIMGWDFRLYFLKGLGSPDFTHDLFFGQHAFSYHAVATFDGGQTIHDACLSVDDDARPWSPPFRERLPAGMPESDYRRQLSRDAFGGQAFGRAAPR